MFAVSDYLCIFATAKSPDGGIGRRAGLKHQWSNPCRFDPGSGYRFIFEIPCKLFIYRGFFFFKVYLGCQRVANYGLTFNKSPSLQYHIYYHWGSYYWGDGIEGKETAGGGDSATEIADKGGDGSCKHGERHLDAMVARVAYHLGYMRHGKTDEGDGTAEGGDYRRQQTSDDQQVVADSGGVDTEVFGITLP